MNHSFQKMQKLLKLIEYMQNYIQIELTYRNVMFCIFCLFVFIYPCTYLVYMFCFTFVLFCFIACRLYSYAKTKATIRKDCKKEEELFTTDIVWHKYCSHATKLNTSLFELIFFIPSKAFVIHHAFELKPVISSFCRFGVETQLHFLWQIENSVWLYLLVMYYLL